MSRSGRMAREKDQKAVLRPASIGAVVLVIAVIIATTITFASVIREKKAAADAETVPDAPKVIVVPARPSTAPTAEPTVNSIKLFAYGGELDADGFTAYVGDRPIVLSIEIEPQLPHPPVYWSVSSSESARLVVSDDRMSCEFTALKPSGKNELIISCYGTKVVFPVYLWER